MTSPLLVFSDDWGRHPSSCQHLARHLVRDRPVAWVNTIGTRSPKFDIATAKRVFGKLKQWTSAAETQRADDEIPGNLTVLNPKMWPYFRSSLDRRLNRVLLLKHLQPAIAKMDALPTVVTTLPITADLVGRLPAAKWVYYCVDDFSQWPGLDQQAMDRMERLLVEKAHTIIAVSETLQRRLKEMGRDSHLLTHGVDTAIWRAGDVSPRIQTAQGRAGDVSPRIPASKKIPALKKIVFWGVIDRRMDAEFVRQLANDIEDGEIILVGPENDPDPALFKLPRVKKLPAMAFEQLPALAAEASVLVMPYADLPVTRAMQPLKLKEYLATGKPVVARDLPANRDWADALDLAKTPEEFSKLVRERMQTGLLAEQEIARSRLSEESWAAKASKFAEWIS